MKYLYHRSFAILAFIIVCPVSIGLAETMQSLESKVLATAKPLIADKKIDGVSIGIIRDGKSLTVHLGQTTKEGVAPTDNTIYEVGSISKVFTGLMLADEVVRGEVKLDQDVGTLFPDGANVPKMKDKPITLLSIATHRSGFPRLPDNMPSLTTDNPYSDYDSKLAYEFLATHKLRRAPGEAAEYSNFAVGLMGHLLAEHIGKTYDEWLNERLAGPLGMSDTSVDLNNDQRSRLATPHSAYGQETSTWEFADMPGAGGIHSSISDMMKFAKAQLDPPSGKLGEAINLAWKEHQKAEGQDFAMGLGWHIARDGQTRWHNGQTGGYHSMMLINRPLSIAVVVLSNTASPEIDPLAEGLIQQLVGAPQARKNEPNEIKVSAEKMKRLEGRYQLAPTFIFDVKVVDGRLMVGVTNQPTHQVYAKSETEWFYKVVDAKLVFNVSGDGPAKSLVLHQNGIEQTAKRIK